MNFKQLLKAALDKQSNIVNSAINENRAMTDEEQTQFNNLQKEIDGLEASIKAAEKIGAKQEEMKKPVNSPLPAEPKSKEDLKLFNNLGDQLKAIKNATKGNVDDRLLRINNQVNASQGMNESVDSDGGFAIQTDFAGMLLNTAVNSGNILPKVDKYDLSSNSNRVEWLEIDETDVSSTVYGGVQVYWVGEGGSVAPTKPKLGLREIKLQKLMGVAYATDEFDQDSNFLSQLYNKAFSTAIQRELENAIIAGDGVGKPLGILKSGSLVKVAKESGQAAGTVVWENISKLYNSVINKDDPNYVWLIHPDVSDQLDFLSFPIGTGGVPVYLPAAQQGSLATLKGHNIIESDLCSAVGDIGDFNYIDLSQYMLITKGGIQSATSIHVEFLTDQNCFRFIFRANGMPKRNAGIKIKNSTKTRSSFACLDKRA